jgi:hypothetical protein
MIDDVANQNQLQNVIRPHCFDHLGEQLKVAPAILALDNGEWSEQVEGLFEHGFVVCRDRICLLDFGRGICLLDFGHGICLLNFAHGAFLLIKVFGVLIVLGSRAV